MIRRQVEHICLIWFWSMLSLSFVIENQEKIRAKMDYEIPSQKVASIFSKNLKIIGGLFSMLDFERPRETSKCLENC